MELVTLHSNDKDFFIAYGESRIGGRKDNQDSFGAVKTARGFLVVVCDGMGGGPGGKTASTIAVREIVAGIEEASKEEQDRNVIIKAIRRANMTIIETGKVQTELRGMGTTATVLLLTPRVAYAAHVGDSRVYQLRGHSKIFRTFDHSMVFELVKQGLITEEQARLSVQSNIITRALGTKPDLEVDVAELPYERKDRFLLCTDGLHGTMPEKELIRIATKRKTALGAVVDDIATYVDNMGRNSGGGHDNLTLAIVESKINSKVKPKMSKDTKLTLLALCTICMASITLNIVQYKTYNKPTKAQTEQVDSIVKKDSIKTDSIKKDTIKTK